MNGFYIFSILIVLVATGAYVNARFLKLPATIGFMFFSLLISLAAIFINRMGWVNLSVAAAFVGSIRFSDLFLNGMLSYLLFAGALQLDVYALMRHKGFIFLMSTVGVVVAAFITGSIVYLGAQIFNFNMPFLICLLFGALIAPTDPVAILGILKETRISESLRIKIAGESLFNDGTAIVLFMTILSVIAQGTMIEPGTISVILLWKVVGSAAIGFALGLVFYLLLRSVNDYKVEVMLTLALVAGSYLLSDILHASAPITAVVAGLVIAYHNRQLNAAGRSYRQLTMFWKMLDEVLNAVLFMLVGLQLMVIQVSPFFMVLGLVGVVAVLVGRWLSVAPLIGLMRLFNHRFEAGTVRLLIWGGLRGGISVALAMSVPYGEGRPALLAMTYIVVISSVLIQGMSFRAAAVRQALRKG